MSYNVASLTQYTEQQEYPLLSNVIAQNRISKLVTIQPGVKGPTAINLFDTDLQWQAGACGNGTLYAGSGSLTLTQRILTPGFIQAGEVFCPEDLDKYYLRYQLKPGSYQQEIPFEQEFTNLYVEKLSYQTEVSLFNGDTTSTTNNLSFFDGWLKNVSASLGNGLGTTGYVSGSVHYSASSGTPITASNVVSIINGIYQSIPTQILQSPEKPTVIVGWDVYNTYIMALQALYPLSLFNFPENDGKIKIPGTDVFVQAFAGMNFSAGNTKYSILAGQLSNFVQGVDLEEDQAGFNFIYNPFADQVQFKAKFKLAANVAKPYEIVWAYNGQ